VAGNGPSVGGLAVLFLGPGKLVPLMLDEQAACRPNRRG